MVSYLCKIGPGPGRLCSWCGHGVCVCVSVFFCYIFACSPGDTLYKYRRMYISRNQPLNNVQTLRMGSLNQLIIFHSILFCCQKEKKTFHAPHYIRLRLYNIHIVLSPFSSSFSLFLPLSHFDHTAFKFVTCSKLGFLPWFSG